MVYVIVEARIATTWIERQIVVTCIFSEMRLSTFFGVDLTLRHPRIFLSYAIKFMLYKEIRQYDSGVTTCRWENWCKFTIFGFGSVFTRPSKLCCCCFYQGVSNNRRNRILVTFVKMISYNNLPLSL